MPIYRKFEIPRWVSRFRYRYLVSRLLPYLRAGV